MPMTLPYAIICFFVMRFQSDSSKTKQNFRKLCGKINNFTCYFAQFTLLVLSDIISRRFANFKIFANLEIFWLANQNHLSGSQLDGGSRRMKMNWKEIIFFFNFLKFFKNTIMWSEWFNLASCDGMCRIGSKR